MCAIGSRRVAYVPGLYTEASAKAFPPFAERRSSLRLPTPELTVAIERPPDPSPCITRAVDVSGDGLCMVLMPEFPPGTELLLTFQLGETLPFLRVPAVVLRQRLGTGAVQFRNWPPQERRRLISYILRRSQGLGRRRRRSAASSQAP